MVHKIVFADQQSATEYAEVKEGKLVWWDYAYIEQHPHQLSILATLSALGYQHQPLSKSVMPHINQIDIDAERRVTVGEWYTAPKD